MDTFARGTAEYDEAHGLYVRGPRVRVVSPGDRAPRTRGPLRWERVASVAHPGVAREQAETPAGRDALLRSLDLVHHGAVGQGQGVDVSEFQSATPSGFSFAIARLLNENNREDSRWRMHKANYDAWGVPCGAYGIVRPGADAVLWANHFADLLAQSSWAFVPTIDVELGDPAANRGYVATAASVLRERGWPIVMGYFSTGGSYRRFVEDLIDRKWGACWGCAYPASFHVHQWSGSPLDRDYCPDFAAISGTTPEDDPLAGITLTQIQQAALAGSVAGTKAVILGDEEVTNHLLSIAAHAPQYLNDLGYEAAKQTVQDVAHHTPIGVRRDGTVVEVGEALRAIWNKAYGNEPDQQLHWSTQPEPPPVTAKELVVPDHAMTLHAMSRADEQVA